MLNTEGIVKFGIESLAEVRGSQHYSGVNNLKFKIYNLK